MIFEQMIVLFDLVLAGKPNEKSIRNALVFVKRSSLHTLVNTVNRIAYYIKYDRNLVRQRMAR
jgi:hypothetical protein